MLATRIRQAAAPKKYLFDFANNPYKAKRPWPPNFDKLSHKYQFQLERRFRRRAKLKWARPTWMKATKILQWGLIIFTLGYGILFMDGATELGMKKREEQKEPPFKSIRDAYKTFADSLWTHSTRSLPASAQQQTVPQSHHQESTDHTVSSSTRETGAVPPKN